MFEIAPSEIDAARIREPALDASPRDAVLAGHQRDLRGDVRAEVAPVDIGGQLCPGRLAALIARQCVKLDLEDGRLDRRDVDDLVTQWVWVITGEAGAAALALRGLDHPGFVDVFGLREVAAPALVTRRNRRPGWPPRLRPVDFFLGFGCAQGVSLEGGLLDVRDVFGLRAFSRSISALCLSMIFRSSAISARSDSIVTLDELGSGVASTRGASLRSAQIWPATPVNTYGSMTVVVHSRRTLQRLELHIKCRGI